MIDVLVFILVGVGVGLLAGLLPGIHPNLFAILVTSIAATVLHFLSPLSLVAFLVSMGITNSFASFIPAISLGAPDASDALATLPGHRLLMHGLGYFAIKLTVIGGLFSLIFSLPLLPFIAILLPKLYPLLKEYMHFILAMIVTYLILTERKKTVACLCFVLSGLLGILGSNLPINPNFYLFPVLTGLFGLPMLLMTIKNRVSLPYQTQKEKKISRKTLNRNIVLGSLAGLITGLLPGIGAAQATVLASAGEKSDEGFLIAIGATTTVNILFSFLAIWLIGKPRSGVAIAINNITEVGLNEFILMIIATIVSGGIAALLTLRIAKLLLNAIKKANYRFTSICVVLFLIIMITILTGIYGLFLTFIATCLGLFALLSRVRRFHLMGVLILPTILFFAGVL